MSLRKNEILACAVIAAGVALALAVGSGAVPMSSAALAVAPASTEVPVSAAEPTAAPTPTPEPQPVVETVHFFGQRRQPDPRGSVQSGPCPRH